jgi:DNA-binding NtrC family response regulator
LLAELLLEPRGRRLELGTVYVREPAEMPRELQDRLARMPHAPDDAGRMPRLIVGHRTDPAESVRAGRLAEELHCTASILTIAVPPLRERLADFDAFIAVFLERARVLTEHTVAGVSPDAALALRGHTWPGNLRELYDVLRSACRRARRERIERADLPFFLQESPMPAEKPLPLDQLLEQAERRLIERALRQAKGNRTRAAEILGIWRARLVRRIDHFGIDVGGADQETEGTDNR